MEIEIPTEYCFMCPEGSHAAVFYDHDEITKFNDGEAAKQIRIRFKVPALSTETKIMLVCRNFAPTLKQSGDLKGFLDQWLGSNFIKEHSVARKFDFHSLTAQTADLKVVHIVNQNYKKPYVHLAEAHPPGTLVKMQNKLLEYHDC